MSTAQLYTAEHIAFAGTGTAYDPETGEMLVYGPASTHKVVNIAQADAYKERKEHQGRQAEFTFADMTELHDVIDVLTTSQCGYLLLLQCYVDYDNGRLINAKGDAMKPGDLLDVLGLKRKRQTFYDFLDRCVENAIITRDEDGTYYVNPRYHFREQTAAGRWFERTLRWSSAHIARIRRRTSVLSTECCVLCIWTLTHFALIRLSVTRERCAGLTVSNLRKRLALMRRR